MMVEVESLSPEQQRFARAFREMQLSSSLFAFAVIQVKPQSLTLHMHHRKHALFASWFSLAGVTRLIRVEKNRGAKR
jgi:hypothetical protein